MTRFFPYKNAHIHTINPTTIRTTTEFSRDDLDALNTIEETTKTLLDTVASLNIPEPQPMSQEEKMLLELRYDRLPKNIFSATPSEKKSLETELKAFLTFIEQAKSGQDLCYSLDFFKQKSDLLQRSVKRLVHASQTVS